MLEIFDCAQNSEEWYAARAGIPTSSEFATVMAKGKTAGSESITRRKYLYKLAGEVITGMPEEGYSNAAMERGHVMEAEAREYYAFMQDVEPQLVGFVRNHGAGSSPDSFVSTDGILEIKTKKPSVLIEAILRDDYPPEHRAQIQGQLWICEREWCDLVCYWPKMPPCIRRIERDNSYIATLAGEVARFNDDLAALVERLQKTGIAA